MQWFKTIVIGAYNDNIERSKNVLPGQGQTRHSGQQKEGTVTNSGWYIVGPLILANEQIVDLIKDPILETAFKL